MKLRFLGGKYAHCLFADFLPLCEHKAVINVLQMAIPAARLPEEDRLTAHPWSGDEAAPPDGAQPLGLSAIVNVALRLPERLGLSPQNALTVSVSPQR